MRKHIFIYASRWLLRCRLEAGDMSDGLEGSCSEALLHVLVDPLSNREG